MFPEGLPSGINLYLHTLPIKLITLRLLYTSAAEWRRQRQSGPKIIMFIIYNHHTESNSTLALPAGSFQEQGMQALFWRMH